MVRNSFPNTVYYSNLPATEQYFQPETVEATVSLLSEWGKGAKILAGGTDLTVLMRSRAVVPRCIIDITRIPGLDYVVYGDGGLRIGALASVDAVGTSGVVESNYPLLQEATSQMATFSPSLNITGQ